MSMHTHDPAFTHPSPQVVRPVDPVISLIDRDGHHLPYRFRAIGSWPVQCQSSEPSPWSARSASSKTSTTPSLVLGCCASEALHRIPIRLTCSSDLDLSGPRPGIRTARPCKQRTSNAPKQATQAVENCAQNKDNGIPFHCPNIFSRCNIHYITSPPPSSPSFLSPFLIPQTYCAAPLLTFPRTSNPLSGLLASLTSFLLSALSTSSTLTSSFTFMIIPANCASTGWKTTWLRLRRPSAARTPWVRLGRPMAERWRVILKKDIVSVFSGVAWMAEWFLFGWSFVVVRTR